MRRKGKACQLTESCTIFAKMGKNILVVAATAKEINPFIEFIRKERLANVDILISGIGLTASTFHLTKQFELKQ